MTDTTLELRSIISDQKIMISNILEIYDQSSYVEYSEGKRWYETASAFSLELCKEFGVKYMRVAGIVAALSPQKSWDENQRIAKLYLEGIYKHTGQNIEKCHRILKVRKKTDVDKILNAPKTTNFFNNIYDPKNPEYCCIDRHAIKIATGVYVHTATKAQYQPIKQAYIETAKQVDLLPNQLQAITWCLYRKYK